MRGHDNAAKWIHKTNTLFCRKIIKLGISVAKISTYALPGQTLEEIIYIFDQFNAWKIPWKYRNNWRRKKQYRSRDLKCVTEYGSTWQHCHVRACVFSVFRACDGYLYCAQMERAQNSDSETHVEKLNRTSRTDLSRKSLSYIFWDTLYIVFDYISVFVTFGNTHYSFF